jgi:hypothetical protein
LALKAIKDKFDAFEKKKKDLDDKMKLENKAFVDGGKKKGGAKEI